ncbi:MAG: ATP synthase F1 subunit delta [Bacteroidales bacterium]|nr:ATP synthase F1 subunit delta [Bacteroidales bacterium]MDY6347005.1 ATP synthase F1 subunit delta [Bacteroidales bacterium]
MKNPRLSHRYAKALFDFAKEKNKTEEVFNDMSLLDKTLGENRDLQLFLRNPIVEPKQKHSVFESVFNGSLDEVTYKFLEVLLKQKREPGLDLVCKEFVKLYNTENNIKEATITTAQPLSEELRNKVAGVLAAQTGAKIILKEKVSPDIVGGFVIQIDDHYLDHSVVSKINKLKQEFSQNIFQVQF